MINLNEYILEKFKINKDTDVDEKQGFFIDCISEIPSFYEHIDDIATCYKDWLKHFKVDVNNLQFDCTEDAQKYISGNKFKKFDRIIDRDEEDDYFSDVDLDGSREYYIYKDFKNVYVYCHKNTFAVTGDDASIFVNNW